MNVHSTVLPSEDDEEPASVRVRALFLSDLHLGTRGCQAEKILDFLRRYEADLIYLVGDIVDGWQLKSSWYWPQSHNDVVQKLLRKARKGARMVYVPGNHDEFMRDFYGTHFGGIEVIEKTVHHAADGRRYLDHSWRSVRLGDPPCPMARLARQPRLRPGDRAKHPLQHRSTRCLGCPTGRCRDGSN